MSYCAEVPNLSLLMGLRFLGDLGKGPMVWVFVALVKRLIIVLFLFYFFYRFLTGIFSHLDLGPVAVPGSILPWWWWKSLWWWCWSDSVCRHCKASAWRAWKKTMICPCTLTRPTIYWRWFLSQETQTNDSHPKGGWSASLLQHFSSVVDQETSTFAR